MSNAGVREWSEQVFGGAQLGDARLVRRLVTMAACAAQSPAGTITAAMGTWAEVEGAFRFVESRRVETEAVTETVAASTAAAMEDRANYFVALDQTELTFIDRKGVREMGPANNKNMPHVRGVQVMSALAVDERGVPVGLLDQQWWSRAEELSPDSARDKRSPEQRESWLWVRCLRACAKRLRVSRAKPWYVMDRAADFWGVLREAVEQGLRVTVRAHHDRLIWRGFRTRKLKSTLRRQPVLGTTTIRIPPSSKRRGRIADFEVRALACTVRLGANNQPTPLHCVRVRETSPIPPGERPIEWLLLTTHEVVDFETALQVVASYRHRWRIEEFHKTWKTGACNVERSQLRSLDALRRWATILAAVATRIERLKLLSRETPDEDALREFTQDELDAAIMLSQTKKYTQGQPMTLNQAVRLVARVGGYPDRRGDGPPGTITIGRGLDRVTPAAIVLKATRGSG